MCVCVHVHICVYMYLKCLHAHGCVCVCVKGWLGPVGEDSQARWVGLAAYCSGTFLKSLQPIPWAPTYILKGPGCTLSLINLVFSPAGLNPKETGEY